MEETGIYDIEDEIMMNIFYNGINRSEDVVFHVMEKEQVSVKVKYDCGEEIVEGNLNMEPVTSAQHPEMYAMMIGLMDICQMNLHPPPPTIISTEAKTEELEDKKDNFYYDYYRIQMVSIYDIKNIIMMIIVY
jgi:hypothetical protein